MICVGALVVFYYLLRRINQRTKVLRDKEQQQTELLHQLQSVAGNSQLTDEQLDVKTQALVQGLKQLK